MDLISAGPYTAVIAATKWKMLGWEQPNCIRENATPRQLWTPLSPSSNHPLQCQEGLSALVVPAWLQTQLLQPLVREQAGVLLPWLPASPGWETVLWRHPKRGTCNSPC